MSVFCLIDHHRYIKVTYKVSKQTLYREWSLREIRILFSLFLAIVFKCNTHVVLARNNSLQSFGRKQQQPIN